MRVIYYLDNSILQLLQTILPLKLETPEDSPQKTQQGWYLRKTIEPSSSKKISIGDLSISKVRLNSMGKTILPRSSRFLTIPVAFNVYTSYIFYLPFIYVL